ncbi:MAG: VWA domain-containing protein, partial [Pseudomonadota bacterium]
MKISKLTHFCGTAFIAMAMGSSPVVKADDTELYLGELAGNSIRHNVLFVLDTSLSMKSKVTSTDKSRIDTLREAMDTLIGGLDNVNVGVMRMNGTKNPENNSATRTCNADQIAAGGQKHGGNSGSWWQNVCYMPTGGTVLFPVANLDAPLTDFASEGGRSEVTSTIIAGDDDASQTIAAVNPTTTEEIIEIAYQQCAPSDRVQVIARIDNDDQDDSEDLSTGNVRDENTIQLADDPSGFIFTFDGNGTPVLPAMAPIISAKIDFTARTDGSDDVDTNIFGESVVKPNDFDNGSDNISNRTQTSALVSWPGVPAVNAEQTLATPDITSIVQEIVNQPGWNNDLTVSSPAPSDGDEDLMNIMVAGDGGGLGREIYARNLSSTKSAELTVTYCANTSFPATTRQRIGLRFQDIRIPQGAEILDAAIDFTAASPNLNQDGTAPTDAVTIYAEDTDDAADFSTSINSRTPTTANESWTVAQMGDWSEGESYSTPDIKAVVQEVTDRGGWCGGNDIAVILEGDTANVMRAAQSFEGGAPPVLRVAYSQSGVVPPETGCNVKTHSIPVIESDHDARMAPNGTMKLSLNGLPMGNNSDYVIGTIFKVPVSPGSTVLSARLVFTATSNATAGSLSPLIVDAEATDDAADFTATSNDMAASNRSRVTGSGIPVNLDVPTAAEGTPFPIDGANVGFDVKPLV